LIEKALSIRVKAIFVIRITFTLTVGMESFNAAIASYLVVKYGDVPGILRKSINTLLSQIAG